MSSEGRPGDVPEAPAIRVHELSKRYVLGSGRRSQHLTIRDAIADAVAAPFRRFRGGHGSGGPRALKRKEIWALDGVSMEIRPGEIVGIVGRNGAGKTTLLKVLSRITEPTGGWAETRGRVGSLLEVGTGFHPELTGRENIFLNGAILGMRRSEINRRFDEIVAFSEVETFLDTPVKRYSSGMYVRLAFSVAAHLDPDILLVDEVLAVGDVAFQRKCLGKMDEVAGGGRTVLFVSHNMAMVQALCRRGIFIADGRVIADGTIDLAVDTYLRGLETASALNLGERTDREGRHQLWVASVEISGEDSTPLRSGRPARFTFRLDGKGRYPQTSCRFTIYNHLGQPVTTLSSDVAGMDDAEVLAGDIWTCAVEELLLVPGRYRIDVTVWGDGKLQDHVEGATFFEVEQGTLRGRPVARDDGEGDVRLPHRWAATG